MYESALPQPAPFPGGKAFFVQGVGSGGLDTNAGNTFSSPFATIKKALTKCVDYRNDTIYVGNYWTPAGETWPIHVNKKTVHILGTGQGNMPYPAIHPSGNSAVFTINESGSYCEIGFLSIGGGSSNAGISLGKAGTADPTKPEGVYIHDCWFGFTWYGTPDHGIESTEYGSLGTKIERCMFLGDLSNCGGKLAENAIEFTTSAANNEDLEIVDCVFKGVAIGINIVKAPGGVITGNKFVCADSADGEAITLGSSTVGILVDGNSAFEGKAAMVFNPYRDLGANNWGFNTKHGLSIMPAII